MNIQQTSFGEINGEEIKLYTLDNGKIQVSITNVGATITSIRTPDRDGNVKDIVLGFDDPRVYLDPEYNAGGFYLGATVGRFANRIKEGKFSLDSKTYQLEINNGVNHLHGGINSFNTKIWTAEPIESDKVVGVRMSYVSAHMENGYPGQLTTTVVFTLDENDSLNLNYQATTDKKTIVNLTNHSYFNLRGEGTILDTKVLMEAGMYTPKDDGCIPTGDVISVMGTPLDFTFEHKIGERIHAFEDGYDHNYVINGSYGQLRKAAEAWDDKTGRKVEFLTTEPAFQFYTGYWLNGKWGRESQNQKFVSFGGFCLEAQHYPDSPNKPQFPSVELKPGETYTQTTVYKFTAE